MNLVIFLSQNRLMNVKFQLLCLLSSLIVSFKTSLWFVCFILCCLFLTLFFTIFPEIFLNWSFMYVIKPLSHDTSERLETIMSIAYRLSWVLWCIGLTQSCVYFLISFSNLQFLASCKFFFWTSCWLICIT